MSFLLKGAIEGLAAIGTLRGGGTFDDRWGFWSAARSAAAGPQERRVVIETSPLTATAALAVVNLLPIANESSHNPEWGDACGFGAGGLAVGEHQWLELNVSRHREPEESNWKWSERELVAGWLLDVLGQWHTYKSGWPTMYFLFYFHYSVAGGGNKVPSVKYCAYITLQGKDGHNYKL